MLYWSRLPPPTYATGARHESTDFERKNFLGCRVFPSDTMDAETSLKDVFSGCFSMFNEVET